MFKFCKKLEMSKDYFWNVNASFCQNKYIRITKLRMVTFLDFSLVWYNYDKTGSKRKKNFYSVDETTFKCIF